MTSLRLLGMTSLRLVVATGALLLGQGCGGRDRRSLDMDSAGAEAGAASSTPSVGVGTDDPAVAETSPFTATPCPGSEWESCIELVNELPITPLFAAATPDDALLLAGTAQLSPSDATQIGFLAKYTTDLELIWFKQLDSNVSELQGLALDATGNSFLVGKPTYDKGSTIAKIAPDGEVLWRKRWPGGVTSGLGLAVDGDGNAVVAGSDSSTVRLAKYSPVGEPLWEAERPVEERQVVNYVAADAQGNAFVVADRSLSNGHAWLSGDIERHTPNGEPEWTVSLEGALVSGVASDTRGDAFALVNIPSVSLVRVSGAGNVLWRKDLDHIYAGYTLSSDSNDNAWVTGYTAGAKRPNLGTVAEYSPEGDTLLSKDFAVPTYLGLLVVAPMSNGRAFLVGIEDRDHPNLVIARLQP